MIGSSWRFIHRSDSFGNICGHRNCRIENVELSRLDLNWLDLNWLELTWLELTWIDLNWLDLNWLDLTDKPYLFHLDYSRLNDTSRICVKKCPDRQLNNLADIYIFYTQTGSSLCRYIIIFLLMINVLQVVFHKIIILDDQIIIHSANKHQLVYVQPKKYLQRKWSKISISIY